MVACFDFEFVYLGQIAASRNKTDRRAAKGTNICYSAEAPALALVDFTKRAPFARRSHTIVMCFFSFEVSSGIAICVGSELLSFEDFARTVRSKCVIAASAHSSQP